MKLSPILRLHEQDGIVFLVVHCPGCKRPHYVPIERPAHSTGSVWEWNHSLRHPTLSPDLVVRQPAHRTMEGEDVSERVLCRSTITDGRMNFADDCAHDLRGWHDLLPFKHPEDQPALPKLDKPKTRST